MSVSYRFVCLSQFVNSLGIKSVLLYKNFVMGARAPTFNLQEAIAIATIHMDVESCRSTATVMGTCKSTLDEQVANLGNTVNGTVGSTWIAPSATEFQSAFQEWATAMKQISEQLAALKQRFEAEIAEFEQAASKLA